MIRQFEAADKPELTRFLRQFRLNLRWGEPAGLTLLAFTGGQGPDQLVGLAGTWHNAWHPHRTYLNLFVAPGFRRQGLGRQLFSEILERSEQKDFEISLASSQTALAGFLVKQRFRLARRCFTPVVTAKDLTQPLQSRQTGGPLSFCAASGHQREAALDLLLDNYRQSHAPVNGLSAAVSRTDFQQHTLSGLDAAHSYLDIVDDRVTAYVLSYFSETEDQCAVGYVGGQASTATTAELAFLRAALTDLFADFETLALEIDDVDGFAMQFGGLFEFDRQISFDAYVFDHR